MSKWCGATKPRPIARGIEAGHSVDDKPYLGITSRKHGPKAVNQERIIKVTKGDNRVVGRVLRTKTLGPPVVRTLMVPIVSVRAVRTDGGHVSE